jgi:glucosylceramidase
VPWGKATGKLLYWKNDAWWWQKNASDWGYFWADGSAGTSPADQVDHPLYEPVYRYARDIIEGLNHWFVGWVDWNLVLNQLGGPNHVGNWAAAPVMVDTETQEIYYTPLYYVMSHFSKFSRPGARVLSTTVSSDLPLIATSTLDDAGHVTLHVLNTTETPFDYVVAVDDGTTTVRIPPASLQTVVIQ